MKQKRTTDNGLEEAKIRSLGLEVTETDRDKLNSLGISLFSGLAIFAAFELFIGILRLERLHHLSPLAFSEFVGLVYLTVSIKPAQKRKLVLKLFWIAILIASPLVLLATISTEDSVMLATLNMGAISALVAADIFVRRTNSH